MLNVGPSTDLILGLKQPCMIACMAPVPPLFSPSLFFIPSLSCDWPVEFLWTDPRYVLCPAFSPFHPLPLPFFIQRLDADNHDNCKSQVLNIAGPQNRRSLDPCTNTWVVGGRLPGAQELLFSTLDEWEISCSCIWVMICVGGHYLFGGVFVTLRCLLDYKQYRFKDTALFIFS